MRAIVTGAASGIGRAAAMRLHQDAARRNGAPAQLVIADVAVEPLKETEELLRTAGAEVVTQVADLATVEAPAAIIARAGEAFGGLDAVISNAGILRFGSLLDLEVADYDLTMAVNTRATWLLAKAAHPLLKASRGCIVATASLAAHAPTPSLGAYAASKAALVMLIKQLAWDWGPDGIRANTVSPGSTLTNIGANAGALRPADSPPPPAANPLGFAAMPEDQAAAIAFLASPDARFITGADLIVDGGASTQLMARSTMANAAGSV